MGHMHLSVATATPARYGGWVPEVVLAVGVAATAVTVALLVAGREWGDPAWMAMQLGMIALAAYVRARRPEVPGACWFALMSGLGPVGELCGVVQQVLSRAGSEVGMAWNSVAAGALEAGTGIAALYLIAFFPHGLPETRRQRLLPVLAWLAFPLPIVLALASEQVLDPWYLNTGTTPNPIDVLPFTLATETAQDINQLPALLWLGAFAVLGLRYRRAGPDLRRRMRWLLLPVVVIPIGLATDLLLRDAAGIIVWLLFLIVGAAIGVAAALGILHPQRVEVDAVLRRTLVYGVLWLAITIAYAGVAALVGVTAGRYLSLSWAVALALLAALLFQPARTRLERLADRWVFGRRTDPSRAIARLGGTLADTFDLDSLLPRMVAALQDGLDLTWARVRPGASVASEDADVVVPVVLDGERLGLVECGPKREGVWTEQDRSVVVTFAGQAALALRNVRLTENLAAHAAEIAASRTRLVRAQESERRRIERNIHDGVQQELVALIGLAGQIRAPDGTGASPEDLALLRAGLTRVLDDLRDLARGIHPSLLSDKGLLPAVEALAARHPVAVDLRADPVLRGHRFAEDAEAACYFTIAEALANSLKHARASRCEVTLALRDGALDISVSDDGVGFRPEDPLRERGQGLAGMHDRFAALDGALEIRSAPGAGTTVRAHIPIREAVPS